MLNRNRQINRPELNEFIFVKKDSVLQKLYIEDILFIRSDDDYCVINSFQDNFRIQEPLKNLAYTLAEYSFVQVHRSYLINTTKIDRLDVKQDIIHVGNEVIPIGKHYKSSLVDQAIFIN